MTETAKPYSHEPVGLLRRMACWMYDGLLALSALMLTTLLVTVATGLTVEHPLYPAYVLLILGVAFLYFGWFWTHSGITLAMQTWRVRLVGFDGYRVTWVQAMRRFVLAMSQWMLLLGGLQAWRTGLWPVALVVAVIVVAGLVWTLMHPQKFMLHDRWSGTRLIRLPDHKAGQV
ncbi:transporter [Ectothiorhodospira haloalkaliphila]|uniref:Transporter n=1 Tax=Ectothiorhodospira haloalkaliphila TaxID=421628 RepID=W8KHW7_9GAMM|nr:MULTISPECIES: RDD family protein [Ectothiorhodospira]AHK78763.1 transporter [Ectothiorhodospira haloalkaliphila]MCG5495279.1 RDD family protein [Ectothiorhodospira variabilis]MCG5497480.1 RDD family protein [Ectothiorhodospira variabilis]MCG5504877.1 RDD family protein [Ectothiorhodospira variabilis]MCG5508034.1 RDD family protein [Ectothiorhodospira variabilis]